MVSNYHQCGPLAMAAAWCSTVEAITDHIARNTHTIDWERVKFPSRDCDTTKRGIWEAITIK